MSVKVYNKLVRDRISDIIEADHKKCVIEILSDDEYLRLAEAKLDEELAEYHKDQSIEELADLLEVVYAVTRAKGYSLNDLEKIRSEKAKMRGGLDKKIMLKEVIS